MTRPFRHSLLALAIASLLAPLAAQADGKGRWINDGFGRSTRDGKGSTCLAAGGDTHAFANADCEGGGDGAKAKAAAPAAAAPAPAPKAAGGTPAPIVVESKSLDAAPAAATLPPPTIRDSSGKAVRDGVSRACVNDSRGSTGADCNVSNIAPPSPAPVTTPAPAAAPAPAPAPTPQASSGAGAASTGAAAAATGAAVAAAGLADGAAALADTDDDDYEDTPAADASAMDDGDDETTWLADGSGPEDDVLGDGADTAPVYAGESLWGEPAAAAAVAADPGKRESDTAPIAPATDQTPAEFPVTKYTVDAAAAEPPGKDRAANSAADNRPAPLLQKTLQMDKGALFDSNSAVLKRRTVPELDELAAFLRKAGNYESVTVIGHTDRLGSDKLNQRLSEKRAKAVRDYLVMRGVDPARITSSGKGRNQPVTAAGACDRLKKKALRSCLAPDRRVEIEAIATVTETVKPK
jgi:OOP family OmpA-OmpF porin